MRVIVCWTILLTCAALTACAPYAVKPAHAAVEGCQYDTQCKADRICSDRRCIAPPVAAQPQAPSPTSPAMVHQLPADCYEGNIQDCYDMGMKWVFGIGGPEDIAQARAYFHKACQGGHIFGCMMLGLLLEEKSTDKAQTAELKKCRVFVVDHYEAACANGSADACYDAARLLDGQALYKLGRDRARARALFDQACEGGVMEACKKTAKKK